MPAPTSRSVLLALAIGSLSTAIGCHGMTEEPGGEDDARALRLRLEGPALGSELSGSPVREAPVPFQRLGLLFDGQPRAGLEVQTSQDGLRWSAWQPIVVHSRETEG